MNLSDLLSEMRAATGYPDTASSFPDWRYQQYKDYLNVAQDEFAATCSPKFFGLIRESTIAITSGSGLATLNDWCQRILELRSADDAYAYKIPMRRSRTADREGLRNSQRQNSSTQAWEYDLPPRSQQALYSSTYPDGSTYQNNLTTYGITVTEGTLVGTVTSSVTLVAAMVGHMIRFNGESADYKIISIDNSAHTITVDRKIRSRVSGDGTTNVGAGYTLVSWEISPPQRVIIRIIPTPLTNATLPYRYMAQARKLVNLTDSPEIQEEYHHLIWKRALRLVGASRVNADQYKIWQAEGDAAMAMFQKADCDDEDSEDGPAFGRLSDENVNTRGLPRGTHIRGIGTF